jgi:hemolysin-activating ACP:hemolysin acyltransferase
LVFSDFEIYFSWKMPGFRHHAIFKDLVCVAPHIKGTPYNLHNTGNTRPICYKTPSFSDAEGNNRCLFWELYQTHR